MLQELYKFMRSPLFWLGALLLVVLGAVQPMMTEYSSKESRELYQSYYDTTTGNALSAEETDTAYFRLQDSRYQTVLYYQNETADRASYPTMLDNIRKQARNSSVFFDHATFAAKNAYKELADYQSMDAVDVADEPSLAITQYLEVTWLEYAILLFGVFLCLYLVTREKELQIRPLLLCTKNGCQTLYVRKLLAVWVAVTPVYLLSRLGKWLVCCTLYPTGNLSRAIQSVYGLSNSTLRLGVGEFLWLTTIVQWLAVLLVITVVFLVCLLFQKTISTCVGIVSVIGFQIALCKLVSRSSVWAPFKFINLIFFLDTKTWIGNYQNINVFTVPVARIWLSAVVMLILYAVSFFAVRFGFLQGRAEHRRNAEIRRRSAKKSSGSVFVHWHGLWYWENLKLLGYQRVLVVLLMVVGIAVFTYRPEDTYTFDLDELYYKSYHVELNGALTKGKEAYLKEERAYYDNLLENYGIENEHDLFVQMVQDEIVQEKMQKYNAFQHIEQVYEYICKSGTKEFVYDSGYAWLFTNQGYMQKTALLLELLMAVLLSFSGLVVYEKMAGMDALIASTRTGRRHLHRIKGLVSAVWYTLLFAVVYTPRILAIRFMYGFWGLNAPANSLMFLEWVPDGITVLTMLVLYHLLLYLIGMIYMIYVYFCSQKTSNQIQTLLLGACGLAVIMSCYIGIVW